MYKAFKYRLYPTKSQERKLSWTLFRCAELYNAALQERRDAYKKTGKSPNLGEQSRSLVAVKEVRPEYKDVHSHVLQDVVKQLDNSFQAFFRRVKSGDTPGYPRFKTGSRWDSIRFKEVTRSDGSYTGPGKLLDSSRVYVPKVGNVRIRLHRPLEGRPKTLTIKREGNDWYAVYTCEVEYNPLPANPDEVGIDLGVNPNFLITSDGEFVESPRYYKAARKKLATIQRRASRQKRRGKRQQKTYSSVAKLHRKVARQRRDFHHKTARKLINENGAVYHENLNVSSMVKSRLSQSIYDAGWSQFVQILSFKAEEAGRRVVGVDPKYTSQDCSSCGARQKVPIGKPYECPCGLVINRDVNAALNILYRGQGVPVGEGNAVARPQ